MRLGLIIDNENKSLVRFTEAKLFFDAKNIATNFFDDCMIINNINDLSDMNNFLNLYQSIFVIKTGFFLTTNFRVQNKNYKGIYIVKEDDPNIIIFDKTTEISLRKKCNYKQGSKQLYIIENFLKVLISHKKMIYYENTENYLKKNYNVKNLYGLASGWKTYQLAKDIGINNLESITVFDYNEKQLEYARNLHSSKTLPETVQQIKNSVGIYRKPQKLEQFWTNWHNYPVNFKLINLFDDYKFENNSLIWISNIFCYEPNIFFYGWENCKKQKNRLIYENQSSIIIEN